MAGVDDGEVITHGKIFISYRRDDDPGFAQALYLRLEQEFVGANLFMDVEGHIKPGDDFVKVLNDQIAKCDVLLAIIGGGWIGARDDDGNRKLEKESDFVRIEIASALTLGKRVIPVLVNKAEMPRADELPESLKPLAHRNAVAIRPTRFKADSQGLMKALKDALAAADLERAAKIERERKAAEEERTRRLAEEDVRAAQLEAAAAREQAQTGLTLEEIRKAEELANWKFIEDSANPAEFRSHIARFPGGVTERYALKKWDAVIRADLVGNSSIPPLSPARRKRAGVHMPIATGAQAYNIGDDTSALHLPPPPDPNLLEALKEANEKLIAIRRPGFAKHQSDAPPSAAGLVFRDEERSLPLLGLGIVAVVLLIASAALYYLHTKTELPPFHLSVMPDVQPAKPPQEPAPQPRG